MLSEPTDAPMICAGNPVHCWFLWNVGCVIRSWLCSFAKSGGLSRHWPSSWLTQFEISGYLQGEQGMKLWSHCGILQQELAGSVCSSLRESMVSFQTVYVVSRTRNRSLGLHIHTHLSLFVSPFKSGLYSRWCIFPCLLFLFCCLFIQILLKCTDLLKHKQMSLEFANQIILGKKSIFMFLQVTKNVSQTHAGK